MGTYKAESVSPEAIVFRHEGEDDHTIEVHAGAAGASGFGAFAPVPQVWLDRATAGKRYYVSLALTEAASAPVAASPEPAEVPAWAVKPEPERQIPSATEPGQVDQLAASDEPDAAGTGEQSFGDEEASGPGSEPSAPSQPPTEGDETTAQ